MNFTRCGCAAHMINSSKRWIYLLSFLLCTDTPTYAIRSSLSTLQYQYHISYLYLIRMAEWWMLTFENLLSVSSGGDTHQNDATRRNLVAGCHSPCEVKKQSLFYEKKVEKKNDKRERVACNRQIVWVWQLSVLGFITSFCVLCAHVWADERLFRAVLAIFRECALLRGCYTSVNIKRDDCRSFEFEIEYR